MSSRLFVLALVLVGVALCPSAHAEPSDPFGAVGGSGIGGAGVGVGGSLGVGGGAGGLGTGGTLGTGGGAAVTTGTGAQGGTGDGSVAAPVAAGAGGFAPASSRDIDGCNCRTVNARGNVSWLVLVAAGLAVTRCRRRSR